MENNKRLKIYSYKKVWKVEKKIYSFGNLKLPIPLNPYDLLAYAAIVVVVLILGKIFPVFNHVPAILRYVVLPYLVAKYFMTIKLDGKNPIMFLLGCARYVLTTKGSYIQNFKRYPEKKADKLSLNWNCSMGRQ